MAMWLKPLYQRIDQSAKDSAQIDETFIKYINGKRSRRGTRLFLDNPLT